MDARAWTRCPHIQDNSCSKCPHVKGERDKLGPYVPICYAEVLKPQLPKPPKPPVQQKPSPQT